MDKAVPVDVAECCRQADGDAQEASQLERLPPAPSKDTIQGLAARVREYQHCPPFVTSERQRPGCPRGIKFGCERVCVLYPPEASRRGVFPDRRHHKQRG